MLKTQSQNIAAPPVEAIVLQLRNNASLRPYIIVENKDTLIGLAIKYRESDDGSTWTDIVGTSVNLNPLTSDGQIVQSNKPFIALSAQGDVNMDVHVVRNYNNVLLNLDDR